MTGKTHMLAGVVVGTLCATSYNASASHASLIVGASILGSLLPDIDHFGSTAGRRALAVSIPVRIFFGHRTITHSLLFAGLALVGGSYLLPSLPGIAWGLFLGVLSHLVLDSLNPSGVPFLYPWPKRFNLASIKTGGVGEMVLVLAAVVFLMGIGFQVLG